MVLGMGESGSLELRRSSAVTTGRGQHKPGRSATLTYVGHRAGTLQHRATTCEDWAACLTRAAPVIRDPYQSTIKHKKPCFPFVFCL